MQDMERVSQIFSEVDFVKQIVLFSDKCSLKEVEKMQDDFKKDLLNSKTTRVALGRYLKNTEKTLAKDEQEETPEDNKSQVEDKKKKEEVI